MRIAVISINYSPELTGISVYSTGMAEHLASAGFVVDCYTAFPYYPHWAKAPGDQRVLFRREDLNGVSVRRHYIFVPSRLSTLKRMLFELSFIASVSVGYLFGPRADCTVIVSPPLFLGLPVGLIARLKGSKTVFHVQDLQPDAAVDLGMLRRGRLADLFYFLERQTYRLCDRVSTISQSMLERVAEKGVPRRKLVLFRNWANDDAVVPLSRRTGLRRAWRLSEKFVVLYSGNIGVKQGLESLLECAAHLRTDPEIVIVIVGDGGEKESLARRAGELGLENVMFRPLQPAARLGRLLATADVSVIPQKAGVKDIVLPSKLGNLMASARPIVAGAAADSELGRIFREADCGVLVEPGNGRKLAEAVMALRADPDRCRRHGRNGRIYMEKHLSARVVLARFADTLLALAGRPQAPAIGSKTT